MIEKDSVFQPNLVPTMCIYHHPCTDGFTSAYLVWKKFNSRVKYVPAMYNEPIPDVTGHTVFIVDFSYPVDKMLEIIKRAKNVVLIDHHKTAIANIKAAMNDLLLAASTPNEYRSEPAFFITVLNTAHSGAYLTSTFLYPDEQASTLVTYVEDYDLYKFVLYASRFINAFISSFRFEFVNWKIIEENLNDSTLLQNIAVSGAVILRKHEKDVRDTLEISTRKMIIGGFEVSVANVPKSMASTAGEILSENAKFSATYIDLKKHREFSLRSRDYGIDVSEIAQKYRGGGGHTHSAGFTMPIGWEGDSSV